MKYFNISIILFALLLITGCPPKEIELPLPEYMKSRFKPGNPCSEIDYMILKFPDSTIVLSDTMTRVRKFDGFGGDEVSVGFRYYFEPFNSSLNNQSGFSYRFVFSNNRIPVKNNNDLIQIGSYKFYNSSLPIDPMKYNGGAEFWISYNELGTFVKSTQQSNYFHVLNKKGNSYELKICGEFDVLISNPFPDTTNFTRVQGEYSITMIDSFFR
jgi:hypothetical protein